MGLQRWEEWTFCKSWWSVRGSNFNSDGSNGSVCINRPLPSNRLRSSSSATLPYCVYFSYLSYFIPVPSFPSLKSLVFLLLLIYIYKKSVFIVCEGWVLCQTLHTS